MKLASLATLLWLAAAVSAISDAPVVTKRLTNVIDSYPQFSKDGKLLLFQSNRSGKMQIYVSKADGTDIRQLTDLDFPAHGPCWSPDMRHIVFAGEPAGHSEIFVMNADGSGVTQLTHTGGDDSHPHWSADGSRIMFNSSRTTRDSAADWSKQWHELFSMKPDGSDVRQHTRLHTVCTYGSFSPDMKHIVYRKVVDGPAFQWDLSTIGRNSEVFVANADGSNEVNLSKNAAFDGWPAWSPDGKRIAFSSNRAGPANTGQIFVVNADGTGLRQITGGTRIGRLPNTSTEIFRSSRSTDTQTTMEGVLGIFTPDNCCIETSFRRQPVLSSSLLRLDPS